MFYEKHLNFSNNQQRGYNEFKLTDNMLVLFGTLYIVISIVVFYSIAFGIYKLVRYMKQQNIKSKLEDLEDEIPELKKEKIYEIRGNINRLINAKKKKVVKNFKTRIKNLRDKIDKIKGDKIKNFPTDLRRSINETTKQIAEKINEIDAASTDKNFLNFWM